MARLLAFLRANNQDGCMKLYYVLDPMCSWCWGFRPVFEQVKSALPAEIQIRYVMGGLAPDSDEPMPASTRDYVQSQWRLVTRKTGADFNWDFWTSCKPRRSTYPACRAVIAAGLQHETATAAMIHAIQLAYYQQARNPSDPDTLVALAVETGLEPQQFTDDMNSQQVAERLASDFELRRQLGVDSFPSLRLETQNKVTVIEIDYRNADPIISQIENSLR